MRVRLVSFWVVAVLAGAFLVNAPMALAQTSARAPAAAATSPLDPLYACAQVTDPTERLACYDRTVAELRGREARQDVVAMDRQQVEQVQRESFGFNLPSLPNIFARRADGSTNDQPREEVESAQTMTVTQVRMVAGRTTLTMDTGQVWQFVDTSEITPTRRAPFRVTIRRAALGSFIMSIEGSNRGYRIRRIQ